MKLKTLAGIAALVAMTQFTVQGIGFGYDEILTDNTVDPNKLGGEVTFSDGGGDTLVIDLKNVSYDDAGSGAGVLLTGIGMVFPGWATISGGDANMGSSTAVNFTKPGDGDVSSEWGYDVDPLNSGALQGTEQPVNTAVSSMVSQTKDGVFDTGSVAPPPGLGGPDFGLASANESDPFGMGVEAIRDSLTINLDIALGNGQKSIAQLIAYVERNWIALTFGSPTTAKPPTNVPEGGATVVLLGFGLWATEMMRRKVQGRK